MAMAVGSASERKVKLWELVLSCLICALGTLAAALVATDSQTRTFFSLEKKARYTDMKALVLLVAANGAAAAYSLLQAFQCAVYMARGGSGSGGGGSSKVMAWSVFSGDQLLAYAVLAAVAAAVGKRGQPELQWMGSCDLYGAFCRQVGGGIACAVAAGAAAVVLASVSAFNLFRLYDGAGGGGKSSGGAARNGGATW